MLTNSTTRTQRLPWLDGLRAVLALGVVLEHALNPQGALDHSLLARLLLQGHAAVTAFIVVSGFSLMYTVTSNGDHLRGGVKGFFWRRTRRILPPYWAALALAIAVCLWDRDLRNGWRQDLWPHFLLLHDWAGWTYAFNPAFWSVAVEEHIYWVFPLILEAWRRFGWGRCVTALTLLGVIAQACAQTAGWAPVALHYFGPFAAGCAAAWLWAHGAKSPRWLDYAVPGAGAACLVAGCFRDRAGLWNIPLDVVWGGVVASAIYGMAIGEKNILRSVLSVRPLAWAGGWSYSLYLVHNPVIELLYRVVGKTGIGYGLLFALVATAAAWAWSLIFERPFLSGRRDPKFADTVGPALRGFPFVRAIGLVLVLFAAGALQRVIRVEVTWFYLLPIVGTVACGLAAYLRVDRGVCTAAAVQLWGLVAGLFRPEYASAALLAAGAIVCAISAARRSWMPVLTAVTISAAPMLALLPALLVAGPEPAGRIRLAAGRTEPVDDHLVSASV